MKKENNPISRIDLIVLWITAGGSVLIALLDLFGFFDADQWPANRIPTLMLLVGGIIAGYLAWERHKHFDTLHDEVETGVERILSVLGGEIKIHRGRQQFLEYITERVNAARNRIDTTSLSPDRTDIHGYQPDREVVKSYEAALEKAVRERSVRLRRVRLVTEGKRLDELEQELVRYAGSNRFFSAVYSQTGSKMPVFNVMIVDDEIAIGGIGKRESQEIITITSQHPLLVELLKDYFRELWNEAFKLNESPDQLKENLAQARSEVQAKIEFIKGMDTMWLRSAELVANTQYRLWVTSFGLSHAAYESEAKNIYNEAFQNLALSNSDIEIRRVARVSPEADVEYRLKQVQDFMDRNNFLLNCVIGGPSMVDIYLMCNF